MGRKLVEATKASRMRRTRGETGRLRFLATGRADFLPAVADFVAGFAVFDLEPDFAAGAELLSSVFVPGGVAGSWFDVGETEGADGCAESDAGELEACGVAEATGSTPLRSTPNASTHHHLRPSRTTYLFFARRRKYQNP